MTDLALPSERDRRDLLIATNNWRLDRLVRHVETHFHAVRTTWSRATADFGPPFANPGREVRVLIGLL
jgi:hypothetical protein